MDYDDSEITIQGLEICKRCGSAISVNYRHEHDRFHHELEASNALSPEGEIDE